MTGAPEVKAAADALRAGQLVAFPTETVYGLGANAYDAAAVAKVFALKGRPSSNPLIVHVCDEAMAREVVKDWTNEASRLSHAFWPGPLSIVLPKGDRIPDIVTAGSPNVAVRCPDHPLTLALIRELACPIVGPSANASGHVSPTTADHVRAEFGNSVFVLDGGPCKGGIESTVVMLATRPPRVLRPGLTSAEEVGRTLGEVVRDADFSRDAARATDGSASATLDSPGLLEKHYAPRTRAVLVSAAEAPAFVRRAVGKVVLLTHTPMSPATPHEVIPLPTDPHAYATAIYAALRDADARGAGVIAIVRPDATGPLWDALRDRLGRATA